MYKYPQEGASLSLAVEIDLVEPGPDKAPRIGEILFYPPSQPFEMGQNGLDGIAPE